MLRTLVSIAFLLPLPAVTGGVAANRSDVPPIETGVEERSEVRLVLVDTVVVDDRGRTVPDLSIDDFEILSWGRPLDVNTLDVACDGGALDDPSGVRSARRRAPAPEGPAPRQIVLAFDYQHLGQGGRELAFQQAAQLIEAGVTRGDRILIAALTGGLRIEQTFTSDPESARNALRRMRYDVTLWNGNFRHQDERGFVGGLTALMDVLGTIDGRKSVVLFSEMQDVPLDSQFEEIAAIAATSRCALYPVDAGGLRPPGGFGESAGVQGNSGFG
jgi:VWFA-related protein